MPDSHFDIPYAKSYSALVEIIAEICLSLLPLIMLFYDGDNRHIFSFVAVLMFLWGLIPPVLEIYFLFSAVPIMRLTKEGIHFYYPFDFGFIDWMDLQAIATQKVHFKQFYRFTFQYPKEIKSHLSLLKRFLFFRIYRKNDLLIRQNSLIHSQKEFFQAIQHYSNVAPDNVDI